MTAGNGGRSPGWYSSGNAHDPASGGHPHTAAEAGGFGVRPPAQHPSPGYSPQGYSAPGYSQPGYAPPGYGYYSPTPGTDELEHWAFQREQKARQHATSAVVLAIIGFFTLPIILGPLAIWQASKARSLGHRATAGLVLGWVVLVWAFTGWWVTSLLLLFGVMAFS